MASTEFPNMRSNTITVNGVTIRAGTGLPLAATGNNGDLHIDVAAVGNQYRPSIYQRQGGTYRGIAG